MLTYFLLAIGFVLLIKGADLLVDGSAAIAKNTTFPTLWSDLPLYHFTSSPELIVSLLASIKGNTDIAIGNVVGST